MRLLLLLYLSTILLLGAVHFSLTTRNRVWLVVLLPGLVSIGFFNFSIGQNNQTLDWLLSQDNLISGIAILLTFEAIVIIFLTILQIKSYYGLKFPFLWKWISLVPPVQLIIALVFLQTYLFLEVSGYSFALLALLFSLCSGLVLWGLAFGIQKIIEKWESRAELKSLVALFQLLMAMFLPLIARGQKVGFTQITIDYLAILFLMALVVTISAIGYFVYKRKNNRLI